MLTTQNDDDHRGDHDEPRGEPPYESLKTSRDEVVCLRQSVEVPGRGIRSMDTSAGIVQLSGEHMQQGTGCGTSSEANCVWFGPFASAFSRRLFNILLPSVWTTDSCGRLDSESHVVYLHANRYIRYNFYNRYALHSVLYRNPKPELYTKKLTTIYIMNTFLPQEVSDLQSASLNRKLHSSIACAYESPSLRVMYNKDHHGSEFRLQNRHNIFGRNNHGQLLEESARHASQNNFTYQRTEQLWSRRDNKDTRGISGGSGSQTPESRLCTMITALRCEMVRYPVLVMCFTQLNDRFYYRAF
ncbi:hypothetical protein DPMN_083572 [Dreissena polymorpha]|uniref:Uncharacterized protein n=1 Tax=Dreissena polymorpha TaxID=45954 RepID=A0A9D3YD46_DREPO|nr:hypothetical protein DPMN_083572 [Dreissena polymorpha]